MEVIAVNVNKSFHRQRWSDRGTAQLTGLRTTLSMINCYTVVKVSGNAPERRSGAQEFFPKQVKLNRNARAPKDV